MVSTCLVKLLLIYSRKVVRVVDLPDQAVPVTRKRPDFLPKTLFLIVCAKLPVIISSSCITLLVIFLMASDLAPDLRNRLIL